MEMDSIAPGGKAGMMFKFNATAYQFEQNGETLIDIDIPNMKRVIGGVDRLAAIRKAIGI